MMKKILMVMSVIGMIAVLSSVIACFKTTSIAPLTDITATLKDNTTTNDNSNVERLKAKEEGVFSVKVIDIDDEVLTESTIPFKIGDTFFNLLTSHFDVDYYINEYGTSINSIEGQITDRNWYCALYENGEYAQTGVDYFELNNGDSFEFRMECFNTKESGYGTFDNYDILVDKTFYHYCKTYMNDAIKNDSDYKSSNFWTYMSINLMKENGYTSKLFSNIDISANFKETLKNVDISTLTGANFCKYYYVSKLSGVLDEETFKTAFISYLNDETKFSTDKFNEYVSPFILAVCKDLNLDDLEPVKKMVFSADTVSIDKGYDGFGWQVASLALFGKYENDEILNSIEISDFGNNASNASILMAFSSMNKNVRDGSDLIKIMFDNYYDTSLNLLKWKKEDNGITFSTNQIYAALASYKVARDTLTGASIFA